MNAAAGESYQDRVRYYRRKAEQTRASKNRQKWNDAYAQNEAHNKAQNEDMSFDFDEALYNFKQSSGFDKMYSRAKGYAGKHAKRHAFEHLSFYRDDEQGYIGGVCAGIADKMNWKASTVRVITVISGLIFTLPTLLVYIAGAVFLRKKNLAFYGRDEHGFWKSAGRHSEVNDAGFANEENI